MEVQGRNGAATFRGRNIVIRRNGLFGQSKAEQLIPIEKVSGIHFKPAGIRSGFIYFETRALPFGSSASYEASEGRGGLRFTKDQQSNFEILKQVVETAMR